MEVSSSQRPWARAVVALSYHWDGGAGDLDEYRTQLMILTLGMGVPENEFGVVAAQRLAGSAMSHFRAALAREPQLAEAFYSGFFSWGDFSRVMRAGAFDYKATALQWLQYLETETRAHLVSRTHRTA